MPYRRSGNRSATALATMKDLGFTHAYHLGGGIGAWTAAGGGSSPTDGRGTRPTTPLGAVEALARGG